MNHGWQSESTDAGVVAVVAVVTSAQLLDVVWRTADVAVA